MSERTQELAAQDPKLEDKLAEIASHMGNLAISMAHFSETTINHERRIQNLEGGRA